MNKGSDVLKETTPLSAEDCFLVMQRTKQGFSYPLHVHPEFELNYLENASGALRMVSDSVEEIGDLDLMLVSGNTKHAYSNYNCNNKDIFEITIQFHQSLFDSLIGKRHFKTIKEMFAKASHGLVFSRDMILRIQPELKKLSNDERPDSFHNLLKLIEILKILSSDISARHLHATDRIKDYSQTTNDRLEALMRYLHENYHRPLSLLDAASLINMSEASLNRFLKKWTGKTFVDNLNEIRITESASRLIDTSDSISEICYKCGFNNLSNFNRIFKSRKGTTPTEYRAKYAQSRFRV